MRRIILLGLTIVGFLGCSLEDALENAPCESDDDCTGSQECIRTLHQTNVGELGWCRSDGNCAAGEQEGCLSANGSCTASTLYGVMASNGSVYCCETGGANQATLIFDTDPSSVQCVVCPSDLCTEGDATEACSVGDARCEEVSNGCGCRIPSDQIENSECNDDATCGEGFVCIRTLEQLEETDESLPEEQAQEPGFCRPVEAPECAGGVQEGCRTDDTTTCTYEQEYSCTATGRCYCCDDPSDSSNFSVHVYAETGAGESAACIQCPNDCESPTPYACTTLEDPDCMIVSGQCGCSANS